MKLFGKIFLPIFISLVIASLALGFMTYYKTDILVATGMEREEALRAGEHSVLAQEKLSKIVKSSAINAKLHQEQAAVISSLDFVKEAYTKAQQGSLDLDTDPQVREARNFLKDNFTPIEDSFVRLTGNQDLRAHFHLANNRSFARVWRDGWQVKRNGKKLDISDDLSGFREMVVNTNRNQKPLQGLELGIGGFVIRGIVPVNNLSGEHAGSIEIYSSYGKLVEETELAEGMTISLVMPASKLSIAKKLDDPQKFPVIDNAWVQVCSSDPTILSKTYQQEEFSQAFAQTDSQYETETHSVYTRRVEDFSGKPIGMLVLTEDLAAWNAAMAAAHEHGHEQIKATLTYTVGLLALVTLVLGGIAYFLAKRISFSVQSTVSMLNEMEAGNLDSRLESKGKDEIALLSRSLNAFADNLRDEVLTAFERLAAGDFTFKAEGLIAEPLAKANQKLSGILQTVQMTSHKVSADAIQVAETSTNLSNGATQQAAALEEISSSMNEMDSQTLQNAENAKVANQLAEEASNQAAIGGDQMTAMLTAMRDIDDAGQNIGKIIKVIDEIAFQTNLLALNAAVEAARAGQHGKGFAVVAEEVRNLAARSAEAARETAELIEGSTEKTQNGTQIAEQTSAAFNDIVDSISKVTDLVAEIAVASNEQAKGISQVTEGVSQLDAVNQNSTAIAEETAAIAEELSTQTNHLEGVLSRFQIIDSFKGLSFADGITTQTQAIQDEEMANNGSRQPRQFMPLNASEFGRF
ncbi:Methyl-accepting chemotaxis protein [Malonomonas rubra DSM 5091]|uniref:Methyl-accepting chemotaxis protein n=1 Tax=Malonomonas rubra DSM 5091 TaxID=1122189 RepID=A0A1M6IME5_MALRU|nr:methyl-accepting chemotaxis protein [Malonomonas rubra]SHJ35686.1 Methyl-accepting chemotaxis protein [Malonomonas rubra DSM 5091]